MQKYLCQLNERNSGNPNLMDGIIKAPKDSDEYMTEWVNLGRPHLWFVVQSVKGWEAWGDCGYGAMALFYNGKFQDYLSCDSWNNFPPIITTPECVYLEPGYWNCEPGVALYFPA